MMVRKRMQVICTRRERTMMICMRRYRARRIQLLIRWRLGRVYPGHGRRCNFVRRWHYRLHIIC